MSRITSNEPVAVRVGDCACAGTPHADGGDVVYLAPHISLMGGRAAYSVLTTAANLYPKDEAARTEAIIAGLGRVWLRYGIESWNFLDDEGVPIPLTPENIELALPFAQGGRAVADVADDLYGEQVFDPLPGRSGNSSARGQMVASTSANRRSRSARRTSSRSS